MDNWFERLLGACLTVILISAMLSVASCAAILVKHAAAHEGPLHHSHLFDGDVGECVTELRRSMVMDDERVCGCEVDTDGVISYRECHNRTRRGHLISTGSDDQHDVPDPTIDRLNYDDDGTAPDEIHDPYGIFERQGNDELLGTVTYRIPIVSTSPSQVVDFVVNNDSSCAVDYVFTFKQITDIGLSEVITGDKAEGEIEAGGALVLQSNDGEFIVSSRAMDMKGTLTLPGRAAAVSNTSLTAALPRPQ